MWVFLLAQMGEIIGALVVKPEFGFFVMFAMPPVRWAIFGRVLFLGLDRRSRFQPFDVMFLLRTLLIYPIAVAVCCVLLGVLVAIVAGVLSLLEPLRVVAVLGAALAYWIGGLRMGGRFDREWLPTAAGNLRRLLER